MSALFLRWTSTAGPLQTKRVRRALSEIEDLALTTRERRGVIGANEHTVSTVRLVIGRREPPTEAGAGILAICTDLGERFAWTIDLRDLRVLEAAIEGARAEAEMLVPVADNRVSPAEQAARVEADRAGALASSRRAEAAQIERDRAWAPILARAAGADALIVATLKEDCSVPNGDYWRNRSVRQVVIGMRRGRREDLGQIRIAAERFLRAIGQAERIGNLSEHRDRYRGGGGLYLSDHGWDGAGDGWRFGTFPLPLTAAHRSTVVEDGLPPEPLPLPATRRAPQGAVR